MTSYLKMVRSFISWYAIISYTFTLSVLLSFLPTHFNLSSCLPDLQWTFLIVSFVCNPLLGLAYDHCITHTSNLSNNNLRVAA
jgi:hypothetical protein